MERFRLRVRHAARRGHVWELHLFPQYPRRQLREADARVLGSSATPEAMLWLRHEDGMRLALAFSAARWLMTPQQRRLFRAGLEELPSEVLLYWFTLCFYGITSIIRG